MTESDWKTHLAPLNEDSKKFILGQFVLAMQSGAEAASLKRKTPDLSERVEELERKLALSKEIYHESERHHAATSAKQKELHDANVREEVDRRLAIYSDIIMMLQSKCSDLELNINNKNIEIMSMKTKHAMEIDRRDVLIDAQTAKLKSINTPRTHMLAVLAKDYSDGQKTEYRIVRTCNETFSKGLKSAIEDGYTRELVRLPACRDVNWGLIKNVWKRANFNHNYATLMPGVSEDTFVAVIHNCEGACIEV